MSIYNKMCVIHTLYINNSLDLAFSRSPVVVEGMDESERRKESYGKEEMATRKRSNEAEILSRDGDGF